MSTQGRQPTRISLGIGSTQRLNEWDFSKISLSLERDLAPTESPLDAYRDVNALLSRALGELQAPREKPKNVSRRDTLSDISENVIPSHNQAVPPRLPVSKLATLQERLAKWLSDLEILDGFDGLSIKPKRYLGESWAQINETVRSLGGKWVKGNNPKDGAWRLPK